MFIIFFDRCTRRKRTKRKDIHNTMNNYILCQFYSEQIRYLTEQILKKTDQRSKSFPSCEIYSAGWIISSTNFHIGRKAVEKEKQFSFLPGARMPTGPRMKRFCLRCNVIVTRENIYVHQQLIPSLHCILYI